MESKHDIPTFVDMKRDPGQLWSAPLRQAVAAALDRQALVDAVFGGAASAAYHMVPPEYPYASEPFRDRYGIRALELSRKILLNLGYRADAPFEFELWHPPIGHYGTNDAAMLATLKSQFEETGLIRIHLRSRPWSQYVDGVLSGAFPAFIIGWSPDFVDPDNWLAPFATLAQSPDQGVNYHNPILDGLLRAAASCSDTTKRTRLYGDIGRIYAEEVPTLPLYWEPAVIAFREGVEGIDIGPPFEFNYHVLRFNAQARPASGDPDTLIIGKTFRVQSLDANDAHARNDWEILKNTGESLLSYKPGTAELTTGVADFPILGNGEKTYTFTLKDGITFADGTPLTAENYMLAWRRYKTLGGQVSGLVRIYVNDVRAPDSRTVVYDLKDTFGFFPAVTASPAFIPINPKDFPADALNRLPDRLDGVGRYRMSSHVPGERMVLQRNPRCTLEGQPAISTIRIKYYADSKALADGLERREVDIAWRKLNSAEAQRLKYVAGVNVMTVNTPLLRYLAFNNTFVQSNTAAGTTEDLRPNNSERY